MNLHVTEALKKLKEVSDPTDPIGRLAPLFFAQFPTEAAQVSWLSDRPYCHTRAFMILQGWGIPQMIEQLTAAS